MHRFFANYKVDESVNKEIFITDKNDINHLSRALRVEVGEEIEICDEGGSEFICKVSGITEEQVTCTILSKNEKNRESHLEIHLFQGLPKSDKLELVIQKCVELGATKVYPVKTDRAIVKIKDDKDGAKKTQRWQKIADEAAKQSKRSKFLEVNLPISFKEALKLVDDYDLFIVPYELDGTNNIKVELEKAKKEKEIKKVGIFIGPEGGISDKEIETLTEGGAISVTLGNRILRTETASITAVAIVQYELGDIGN